MTDYPKASQTSKLVIKLQNCKECEKKLPRINFTSTRARICHGCKIIRKLEQQKASLNRALERSRKSKQKKKIVISVPDLKKRVQKVVNKYIRHRDADDPCISCQRNCGAWNAGHYVPQGSSGYLRYDFNNIHKQGVGCNKWKHGNLIEYRINLVKKIGLKEVERLERDRHKTQRWTREELLQLEKLVKELLLT